MRDDEYYRYKISKRTAVKALVEINKAIGDTGNCYFWDDSYVACPGGYDTSVRSMVDEIKRLKAEVEEYRALREALAPIVKHT